MKRTSILAALILSASISADAASPKISHDTPTRGAGLVDVDVSGDQGPNGGNIIMLGGGDDGRIPGRV